MDKDAQQRLVLDLVQQKKSASFIQGNTKMCPGCNMHVEHSGGCNKMVCVYCYCMFCYKCGKMIEGYSHFGDSSCDLFDEEAIAEWENAMNGRVEEHRPPVEGPEARRNAMEMAAARRCEIPLILLLPQYFCMKYHNDVVLQP